jgi:UbiD family decarboxylase
MLSRGGAVENDRGSFREFVEKQKQKGTLVLLKKPCSLSLELAGVMKALDGKPVYCDKIKEVPGARVAGNVFCTRELICEYFGIRNEELMPKLVHAINNPSKPELVEGKNAPVLEVTEQEVDLSKFPIPFHAPKDGGPYFASAVGIANDKEYGRNCSFHRMMVIGKDRVAVRILPRHLEEFIKRAEGELEVAFVVGAPINVLLAAAISVEIGKDELQIANSLAPLRTVRLESGIEVPADAEYVFEGRITSEMVDEGPFVDLTETYDIVRKQRVMKITKVHHRKNPIFHVLLPGALEHKLLMGMPREPTIFNEVGKVAECKGVNITPGGCSWLHAVVAVRKKKDDDGKNAIEAAFRGHKSLKHVVVVDEDIDIYDPESVEWAIATRVQADKRLVIKHNEKGSSLDPSADPNTYATTKMGVDATKPLVAHGKNFEKAEWKAIKKEEYV